VVWPVVVQSLNLTNTDSRESVGSILRSLIFLLFFFYSFLV